MTVGPMSLAPLSEYFGRSLIYIIWYGIPLPYLVGTALVKNLGGFLCVEISSGRFCECDDCELRSTIADLWDSHDTVPAISVFYGLKFVRATPLICSPELC